MTRVRLVAAAVCAVVSVGSVWRLQVSAQSPVIVISEFRTRGPAGGNDEFIELYNAGIAPVELSGWKIKGSNASGTASTRATIRTPTWLKPGCHLLVINTASSGYSGSAPGDQTYSTGITDDGGIAITTSNDEIVDQAGMSTGSAFKEGMRLTPFTSVNFDRSYERRAGLGTRYQDTQDNASDFVLRSPSAPLGKSACEPAGVGTATPAALDAGMATTLTVKVTPATAPTSTGLAVSADLTAIGGIGSQPFYDDGSNGDLTANDNTFTFGTTVPAGTPVGTKTMPATISDAQGRSSIANIVLVVQEPPKLIHVIQGREETSPLVGQRVTTSGIVTAVVSNGFFIQTPDADVDDDPLTSEGLFIFTSTAPSAVSAGQRVSVTGTVLEFQPAGPGTPSTTELGQTPIFAATTSRHALPSPAALTREDTPPGRELPDLERYEGMRVTGDFEVVSPTGSFSQSTAQERNADPATSTGEFYAVVRGVARPFREPGLEPDQAAPAGAPSGIEHFDGNPERLRVDEDRQIGAAMFDVAAGQVLRGFTGVLEFSFGSWTLLPDPSSIPGCAIDVCGAAAVPVPAPGEGEFTIASFNMERFFDTSDDRDTSDVVLTAAAFERRLSKVSATVRAVLGLPDILGAVEVENLAALAAIADRINADAHTATGIDPRYVAYLEEGNDIGGIDVGFLVKTSRVDVVSVQQVGKDATYIQPDGVAASLNDRPPLVLEALVHGPVGDPYPVTVIVNHLRSLNGIAGADGARIRVKRLAQAEFLAREIQRRQSSDARARIVAVGDFNAFEFHDGYTDLLGSIRGVPASEETVVLTGPDVVEPNLHNLVTELAPASERYSFVFDGNPQTLDHVVVSGSMRKRATQLVFSRGNADFPESLRREANRPERVSDHDAPVAYFAFPSAPVVSLNGDSIVTVEAYTGTYVELGATAGDEDGRLEVDIAGDVDVSRPGTYKITYGATNGYLRSTVTRTVRILDRTAPVISGFAVSPETLWAPNHQMVEVTATYRVIEASQLAACTLLAVSNQADEGRGDGHTSHDIIVLDARRVQLRAERSGLERARTYTVTLTCEDPANNRTMATGVVRVGTTR